ncbi:hypothetical protein [Helicobacter salomonis]|uniref:hypothetical protein n=1 Tax=Helicobacter salomonis TaxID=56878 RepID=UPI000CF1BD57|nr:hypothetical protein [Helicobacter salomonis]
MGYANAYVLEGFGSSVSIGFYRLPPGALKGVSHSRKTSLLDIMLGARISDEVAPILDHMTTYEARSVHLRQYEGFINKCQKHVQIELPQMGSHVNASSTGPYHVNFHWKF